MASTPPKESKTSGTSEASTVLQKLAAVRHELTLANTEVLRLRQEKVMTAEEGNRHRELQLRTNYELEEAKVELSVTRALLTDSQSKVGELQGQIDLFESTQSASDVDLSSPSYTIAELTSLGWLGLKGQLVTSKLLAELRSGENDPKLLLSKLELKIVPSTPTVTDIAPIVDTVNDSKRYVIFNNNYNLNMS
jgi:hypothetical protein